MHEEHDTIPSVRSGDVEQQVIYSRLVPSVPVSDSMVEITSLLILYRSPLAAVQLPRWSMRRVAFRPRPGV